MKIYNGEGYILGRFASIVAKELLKGEKVIVYNSEKLFITGTKSNILEKYVKRRAVKSHQNPEHSPKWPRRPDLLVKRIIRGMLPWSKPRGRLVFKNLKVYMGKPELVDKFADKEITLEKAQIKEGQNGITIEKLCSSLGYHIKG
ncbi:50S ribosomal protein L13 [Candidatus Micrarchaeota archaeon]|nr:50S ribosomal protein L13 [Candidatus Micrarchaeota archaeon]